MLLKTRSIHIDGMLAAAHSKKHSRNLPQFAHAGNAQFFRSSVSRQPAHPVISAGRAGELAWHAGFWRDSELATAQNPSRSLRKSTQSRTCTRGDRQSSVARQIVSEASEIWRICATCFIDETNECGKTIPISAAE